MCTSHQQAFLEIRKDFSIFKPQATNLSNISQEDSFEQIKTLLRLEYLNKERKEHVYILITKYQNFFHLLNDKFTCTDATNHKIITTDERPIYIKQYCFPPIHKDKINKQV